MSYHHPLPRTLSVARILLFVRFALGVLSYVLTLALLDGMSRSEADLDYGMTKGVLAFLLLLGTAMAVFDYYVAATVKRGGRRAQTFARTAAGLGFAGVLLNLVLGRWLNAVVALALAVAVVLLVERAPSREWFEVTQRGAKYTGG
ncbi:hypothetical protein ACWFMI_06650 [Nocardiopsis terrae]